MIRSVSAREKYLLELAKDYPNRHSVTSEIINLNAILNLPKGTEHFLSDIHGEHEAYMHVSNCLAIQNGQPCKMGWKFPPHFNV